MANLGFHLSRLLQASFIAPKICVAGQMLAHNRDDQILKLWMLLVRELRFVGIKILLQLKV